MEPALTMPPPHGLVFHHFHGQGTGHQPGQGSLNADAFEALLRGVGLGHILPTGQFLEHAQNSTLAPEDCCITFDNNLRCQFDIAVPVLRRL